MNFQMYIETQVLCIVILWVLMWFNKKHNEPKTIVEIYIVSILASLADVFRILSFGTVASHIFVVLYICCIGGVGVLWVNYCLLRYELKLKFSKVLTLVPALTVTALYAFSVKNGMMYTFDNYGAINKGYAHFITYILLLYAVVPVGFACVKTSSEISRTKIAEQLKIALCPLPLVFGAVSGAVYPAGINTIIPGICVSMLILYISFQYKKILFDNLTGIQNRYGLDEEIEEQLRQYRIDKNDSFYIISCDMDNFKTINDSWGHPEGDRALKLIAGVLVKVSEKYKSTAFRVGGDEFIIITDTSESGLIEHICGELRDELDNLSFRDDFEIRMSMGTVLYDGTSLASELISQADKKLYVAKRNKNS